VNFFFFGFPIRPFLQVLQRDLSSLAFSRSECKHSSSTAFFFFFFLLGFAGCPFPDYTITCPQSDDFFQAMIDNPALRGAVVFPWLLIPLFNVNLKAVHRSSHSKFRQPHTLSFLSSASALFCFLDSSSPFFFR